MFSALQYWPGGAHTYRVQLLLLGALEEPYPRHPTVPPEAAGVWGLGVQGRHHPLKKAIGVTVNSADLPVDAHKGSLLMITPEKQAHAVFLKVAYDVRQGPRTTHNGCWCS